MSFFGLRWEKFCVMKLIKLPSLPLSVDGEISVGHIVTLSSISNLEISLFSITVFTLVSRLHSNFTLILIKFLEVYRRKNIAGEKSKQMMAENEGRRDGRQGKYYRKPSHLVLSSVRPSIRHSTELSFHDMLFN